MEAGSPSFHEEFDLLRARLALPSGPPVAAVPPPAAGLSGCSASGAGFVLFGAELEDWKAVIALLANKGLIPTHPLEVAAQLGSFHRRWCNEEFDAVLPALLRKGAPAVPAALGPAPEPVA